jgi:hypothetical protein
MGLAIGGVFAALQVAGADRVVGVHTLDAATARWWIGVPIWAFAEELIFRGFVLGGMLVVHTPARSSRAAGSGSASACTRRGTSCRALSSGSPSAGGTWEGCCTTPRPGRHC